MSVSVRSSLTAGMAAVVASALTIAPMQVVAPETVSVSSLRLSAAVQPLVAPVTTAAAALGLVSEAPKPAAATSAAATPQAAATGDWVISSWNWINYWVSYGADLVQYALGWVWPLSLIGDQAPLLWDNLGVPIGNALVYGLIVPVLNDPLNLAVWGTGLSIVIQSTFVAAVNTVIAEAEYFLSWILPPLPPLPFPPFPVAALASPLAAAAAGGGSADTQAEDSTPAEAPKATGHSGRAKAVKDTPSVAALSAQVAESTSTTETPDASPETPKTGDTSSDNGGATKPGGTAKKSGATGGSARAHKAKSSGE